MCSEVKVHNIQRKRKRNSRGLSLSISQYDSIRTQQIFSDPKREIGDIIHTIHPIHYKVRKTRKRTTREGNHHRIIIKWVIQLFVDRRGRDFLHNNRSSFWRLSKLEVSEGVGGNIPDIESILYNQLNLLVPLRGNELQPLTRQFGSKHHWIWEGRRGEVRSRKY